MSEEQELKCAMSEEKELKYKKIILLVIFLIFFSFVFLYHDDLSLPDEMPLPNKKTAFNDDLSLADKVASLSLAGVKDYQNCVEKGQVFKDFLKENTNIKTFCVNQIYGKENNLHTVKIDPMTRFFYLIRETPEYEEIFINCITTKKGVAEEFLINQSKNEKEEDATKKELKWKIGQSCAKEIVEKTRKRKPLQRKD